MCHKCQRIVIAHSIYETILEEKLDNKSQKRKKICFPERKKRTLMLQEMIQKGTQKDFKIWRSKGFKEEGRS